ncbi:Low-affinity potassium transport protein [Penicillium oxalicum]|uniref:Low-affinity potassium transport protein n=1 Tax=Penicillium oxalicum TaxID=69781 RepID=UPI0020B6C47F|nr:Low-affinity potassium transport protein [Penicillium oxalicum]KAI2787901.1 Low-affinity potassium transport protein [Penicillium oxalicum]
MEKIRRKSIRSYLPHVRFLTVHYAYFIIVTLVCSGILWGSSTPAHSLRYIDALYLAVSAMTLAGMNTVNLSTLNTFQQLLLFFLIMSGSAIWVSIGVVLTRKRAFERRFSELVKAERLERKARSQIGLGRSLARSHSISRQPTMPEEHPWASGILPIVRSPSRTEPFQSASALDSRISQNEGRSLRPRGMGLNEKAGSRSTLEGDYDSLTAREANVEATSGTLEIQKSNADTGTHVAFSPSSEAVQDEQAHSLRHRMLSPYTNVLDRTNTLGELERGSSADQTLGGDLHADILRKLNRNSSFYNLTEKERQRLGGAEYRLLGGLGLGAYLANNKASVTESNGLNPWWTGFFFAVSAFNNSGMSLLDANMVPFQTSPYILITMGLLILAGNTCYPIFLRCIVKAIHLMLPKHAYFDQFRDTLTFLLNHPRRVYTTLFPSAHTWWLLLSVIVLNGIDWLAFEVLNLDNPSVTSIPTGARVLDGLFQALCVRSGGFYLINIGGLQLGTQMIYVVMMYISVYPVVITMRHSNVYEERSLGIYADDLSAENREDDSSSDDSTSALSMAPTASRFYFIRHQLRSQLAYDLWWIALAVIIVCIVEAGQFTKDPVTFSALNIIFETVSAYGCVGISTGLPDQLYSFSGGWHTLSKLVLCAVMIRGRHRGLPVAIDKAIMLPSDKLMRAEEEDAQIRLERTMSRR